MTNTSTTTATIDPDRAEAFTGRVVTDTAGLTTVVLASIGDQLGLWRHLAEGGSATSAELAERTDTNERYVREWLAAMHAAGYVEYDSASRRFTLPLETRLRWWTSRGRPSSEVFIRSSSGSSSASPTSWLPSATAAASARTATPTTSTWAWTASPPCGTRTCSSSNGCLPAPTR